MTELFPEIEPYRQGRLAVDDRHTLYFEECGNPSGLPVVFLHGGPGGGASTRARRLFDPARFRAVLFDQRGCGRSTPFGELVGNTTWDLVDDLERLRQHLQIERWLVFGGSWGSTLALAYGQTYPTSVLGFVLRGVFTFRQWELDWFMRGGLATLKPHEWEKFVSLIPVEERGDLIAAYYRRLTSSHPAVRRQAAASWSGWEASNVTLLPNPELAAEHAQPDFVTATATIGCHFEQHRGWLDPEDQLLRGISRVAHLPAWIVQGQYDLACPLRAAHDVHRAWPGSELIVVPDGAHTIWEPSMLSAVLEATKACADAIESRG